MYDIIFLNVLNKALKTSSSHWDSLRILSVATAKLGDVRSPFRYFQSTSLPIAPVLATSFEAFTGHFQIVHRHGVQQTRLHNSSVVVGGDWLNSTQRDDHGGLVMLRAGGWRAWLLNVRTSIIEDNPHTDKYESHTQISSNYSVVTRNTSVFRGDPVIMMRHDNAIWLWVKTLYPWWTGWKYEQNSLVLGMWTTIIFWW